MTPTLSVDAVQVSVILRLAGVAARFVGAVGGVVSPALLTVTLTAAEVLVLPAASYAFDVSACAAFDAVVVFHDHEYGEVVSVACSAPSR